MKVSQINIGQDSSTSPPKETFNWKDVSWNRVWQHWGSVPAVRSSNKKKSTSNKKKKNEGEPMPLELCKSTFKINTSCASKPVPIAAIKREERAYHSDEGTRSPKREFVEIQASKVPPIGSPKRRRADTTSYETQAPAMMRFEVNLESHRTRRDSTENLAASFAKRCVTTSRPRTRSDPLPGNRDILQVFLNLYKDGIITKEEYERRKDEVISNYQKLLASLPVNTKCETKSKAFVPHIKEEKGNFVTSLFEEDSNLGSPNTSSEEFDPSFSLQFHPLDGINEIGTEPASDECDSSIEENYNSSPSPYLQLTTEPHAVELEPLPFDDLEYAFQLKSFPPIEDRHCSDLSDATRFGVNEKESSQPHITIDC